MDNYTAVSLHTHPELMKQCCDLINSEWPRSETARMISLQASCDKLPTSLVLLDSDKKVLGHCKLTRIPNIEESCFIESVVIKKELRGKKLGTKLMIAAEEHCRSILGRKMMHLSTKGQEFFYEKLGYKECEPVSIYGGYVKPFNVKNNIHLNYNNSKNDKTISLKTAKTYMHKYL